VERKQVSTAKVEVAGSIEIRVIGWEELGVEPHGWLGQISNVIKPDVIRRFERRRRQVVVGHINRDRDACAWEVRRREGLQRGPGPESGVEGDVSQAGAAGFAPKRVSLAERH